MSKGRGSFRGPMTVSSMASMELGKERIGPVLDRPELYPSAHEMPTANVASDPSDRVLIGYSRTLVNHWVRSVWNVKEVVERPEIETWRVRLDREAGCLQMDASETRQAMLNSTGPEYFPPELCEEKYIPPTQLHKKAMRNLKKLEDKERRQMMGGEGNGVADDDGFSDEEDADSALGDADYAVNHYEDDDDFGDDGDGDGDGDAY